MLRRVHMSQETLRVAVFLASLGALSAGCGPLEERPVDDAVATKQGALSLPLNQQMALDGLFLDNKSPGLHDEMHFFPCVDEYGTCTLGGPRLVAFGQDGDVHRFVFANVSGTFLCDRSTFGGQDPSPNNL